MLAQAEAQKPKEEAETYYSTETDPLEDFSESLNRQILSRLSSRLIQSAFGEADLEAGHYEIGNFIIDIEDIDSGIRVIITDPSTGQDTTIEIPYY
jgi:curli production assembly/transport component CsgF